MLQAEVQRVDIDQKYCHLALGAVWVRYRVKLVNQHFHLFGASHPVKTNRYEHFWMSIHSRLQANVFARFAQHGFRLVIGGRYLVKLALHSQLVTSLRYRRDRPMRSFYLA